jgi:hypothetical protein
MKNHSFDDLVKQKVSGHEAPVPPGTWDAIKKEKKKRRPFLFWWITGIVLFSGGSIGILYRIEYRQKNTIITSEAKNAGQAGNDIAVKTVEENNSTGSQITLIPSDPVIKTQKEHTAIPENKQRKQDVPDYSGPVSPGRKEVVGLRPSPDNMLSADNSALQNDPGRIVSKLIFEHSNKSTARSNKNTANMPVFTDTAINTSNTTDILFAADPYMQFSYQEHNRIATLITAKNVEFMTDSANVNSRVMQYADSLKNAAATIATVINRKLKKDKWTLEISVTPFLPDQQTQSIPYLTRTSEGNMQKSEYKADRVHTRLQPSVAYTIGIYKKISPRLQLGAGLQYAMIKEKVDLEGKEIWTRYTEVQRLLNGSGGSQLVKDTVATTSSGTLTIDALNSYRFISIPLSARYKLMERGSWSMQADGGVVIYISANYHNQIEGKFVPSNNQGVLTGRQKNDIAFDLFAGFRVSKEYTIINIFAEPVLRYNIRRHELSDMINRKFIHSAGLSLGVSYRLKH